MRIPFLALATTVTFGLAARSPAADPAAAEWAWYERTPDGQLRVNLYVFWSARCPHCPPALAFADDLKRRCPWVSVQLRETSADPANLALYQKMAARLKQNAGTTPAFFYCNHLHQGFVSADHTGARIEKDLKRWYDALKAHFKLSRRLAAAAVLVMLDPGDAAADPAPPAGPDLPVDLPPAADTVAVPGWGEVAADGLSLPALTLVLAGADAFNPCAFFVLLTLLSVMVHGRSRGRMLVVGGVFVLFSGGMYFLFMAAWLNLFVLVGELRTITVAAGAAAVAAAALNVKDFVWFKAGPSLSIPDAAKPDLFRRMGRLARAGSYPAVVAGTAGLAFAANLYELLCTAGFPMVYTRVLTLRNLSPAEYYGYLAAYNLIYVLPLAAIVTGFALTLGARKLTEYQGRVLKLLSGAMLLALGGTLLAAPDLLHSAGGAIGVMAAAVGVAAAVAGAERLARRPADG